MAIYEIDWGPMPEPPPRGPKRQNKSSLVSEFEKFYCNRDCTLNEAIIEFTKLKHPNDAIFRRSDRKWLQRNYRNLNSTRND